MALAAIPISPTNNELARRAASGDGDAREALIARFLPEAERIADGFARRMGLRGPDADDCRQNAALALIQAIDRNDPARPDDIAHYLRRTVYLEVYRAHVENGIIRVPRSQDRELAPTVVAIPYGGDSQCLDDPAESPWHPVSPEPSPEDIATLADSLAASRDALATIPPGDRALIGMIFGLWPFSRPHTFEEAAAISGMCRSGVAEAKARILATLRAKLAVANSGRESDSAGNRHASARIKITGT